MFALLRDKNFRLLWFGQFCSQAGDRLTQLVLVALVAQRSAGSALSMAGVMAATSVPALLVNPFAGAFVDRWDRRRTMMICDFIRAAAVLALPGLALVPSPQPLYAGIFVVFAVAGFFVPARLAIIPDLVASESLARANTLFVTSGMIGSTVILLAGALLVEWVGAARAAFVVAGTYLASALFILPLGKRGEYQPAEAGQSASRILTEVAEGFREMWHNRATRRVMGILAALMGGAGATMVVGAVLVQKSLHTVTKDLGFLSLWMGIGMLAGTLVHGRWGTSVSKRAVMGVCFIGCGLGLAGFTAGVSALGSAVAASFAAAWMGVCVAPVGIVTNTLVHEAHPERLHGRIFSSLGVAINLSLIGSMLAAGWLAEKWGEEPFLGAVAACFATVGTALLYYGKRHR
ncbi:MAG: MFS transporter [Candidatus Omnitrophica bacterium]|nr:MFS transporter [Candidatus Omnitrophota bacterium]